MIVVIVLIVVIVAVGAGMALVKRQRVAASNGQLDTWASDVQRNGAQQMAEAFGGSADDYLARIERAKSLSPEQFRDYDDLVKRRDSLTDTEMTRLRDYELFIHGGS